MNTSSLPSHDTFRIETHYVLSRRFRLLNFLVLYAVLGILTTQQVFAIELPAYVNIAFSTTTTVEQSHNPQVLNGVVLFPIKDNLYSAVDGLPEDTPILSLNLRDLKVSILAVELAGTPEEQVVTWRMEGRLEYKTEEDGPLLTLCTFSGQLSSRERVDLNCTAGKDFQSFAADLNYDVTTDNTSTRHLNKMLLFSTVRVYDGGGVLPRSLDLDIAFTALAESKFKL